MKTIKEWFESYPDEEVRNMLLSNMIEGNRSAISIGFVWDETDQGQDFWSNIYANYTTSSYRNQTVSVVVDLDKMTFKEAVLSVKK